MYCFHNSKLSVTKTFYTKRVFLKTACKDSSAVQVNIRHYLFSFDTESFVERVFTAKVSDKMVYVTG